MNIAYVVHRYSTNDGTGRYVVELGTRIAAEHAVTVYTASVDADVPPNMEIVRVPAVMARAYTAILSFPTAFRMVRRAHDIVHAQGWVTNTANVVTAHIVLAAWRAAARGAGVRSPAGERLFGPYVTRREARLVRRAERVIAPSARAAADLERCYGVGDTVRVIPHGFPTVATVPQRAAARRALGLGDRDFIALFAGDPRKGLDVALDAVRALPTVHLAVASHTARGAIEARAARAGVSARVHALGPVRDMATAYAASDVLLHPTIYDTFGLVVAEAVAYGVPPIITRAAGVAELTRHMTSAWVLETPSATEIGTALSTLAGDSALRARMSERARALARTRTWDTVARETLACYRELSGR